MQWDANWSDKCYQKDNFDATWMLVASTEMMKYYQNTT